MSKRSSLLIAGIFAMTPAASLHAQDAHVHGIASINLVIENNELEIEFESPAANIVGFEYEAETEADKGAIQDALKTLRMPEMIFGLPASAGCKTEDAEAELHGHGGEHDEHKEAHGDEHDEHDEHEEAHGHDEHDEHGDRDAESHSEFQAHYHFECADSSKLTEIALPLFERFSGVQEIHLQAITPWGQFGGDIEPQDGKITLK